MSCEDYNIMIEPARPDLQAVMGLSERRACSFVGADRKMIRHRSCRAPETELRGRLRDLANERRRFPSPLGSGRTGYNPQLKTE